MSILIAVLPSDIILPNDWETLATLLPDGYKANSLDRSYRKRLEDYKASALGNPSKASPVGESFLSKLNDVEVSQLVECIKRAGCPAFVPLRVTLDIKKTDGKALSQIMSHVMAWANPAQQTSNAAAITSLLSIETWNRH